MRKGHKIQGRTQGRSTKGCGWGQMKEINGRDATEKSNEDLAWIKIIMK